MNLRKVGRSVRAGKAFEVDQTRIPNECPLVFALDEEALSQIGAKRFPDVAASSSAPPAVVEEPDAPVVSPEFVEAVPGFGGDGGGDRVVFFAKCTEFCRAGVD